MRHEYNLTIGLFDKNEKYQIISTDAANNIIENILINQYEIFAFTTWECKGVYKMNSDGDIVKEPSIRIEIVTDEQINDTIKQIIETLKDALNQESIMIKHLVADIDFL